MAGLLILIIPVVVFAVCYISVWKLGEFLSLIVPACIIGGYLIYADVSRSAADFYPMAEMGLQTFLWFIVISAVLGWLIGLFRYANRDRSGKFVAGEE